MTAPQAEPSTRDQYLTEANAELDALLGEVGEIETSASPRAGRTWLRVVVVAVIAVAVLAIGVLLLRGRRSSHMVLMR